MSHFMVGRQPIFDAHSTVHGYELLFKGQNGPDNHDKGAEAMTADVFLRTGLDVGLASLVGDKLAFVTATRAYVLGEQELLLPDHQTVLQIPTNLPRSIEIVAGCRRLRDSGYALALEGKPGVDEQDPLLELATMVKLDPGLFTPAEADEVLSRCSARGLRAIAKGIEARHQMDAAIEVGFDLYEGYLLSRPETVEGHELSPNRLTCLRIIDKLCDPATSASEIEQIVRTDPALSFQFLRVAGAGAAGGFFRQLSSVRDAIVLLGERRIRAWVTLMLLAGAHEGSDEQLNIAMTRARMAELLALEVDPHRASSAFTVGLVSALDLLLRSPLSTVMESLTLDSEVADAILWHSGVLGGLLADVMAWEVGAGEKLSSGVDPAEVEQCYLKALSWASQVCGALEPARL
jgi:EAL and modified HD-GYP domain-containing signal transduction protein